MTAERLLYEHSPALLLAIDSQGRLIAASNPLLAAIGYQRDQVIGRPWQDLLAPSGQASLTARLFPVQPDSSPIQQVPITVVRRDGQPFSASLSAQLIDDSTAAASYWSAALTPLGETPPDRLLEGTAEAAGQVSADSGKATLGLRAEAHPGDRDRTDPPKARVLDFFWIDDPHTRRPLYNGPNFEAIWGIPEAIIQEGFDCLADYVVEADKVRFQAWTENTFTSLFQSEIEFRIYHSSGEIRWLKERCFPILDEAQNLVKIVGFTTDITTQKQAEIALKESEERLRLITETVQDHFWIDQIDAANPETPVPLYDSPSLNRIWGLTPEQLSNGLEALIQRVHPEDRAVFKEFMAAQSGRSQPYEREFRICHPTQGIRHLYERIFPVLSPEGNAHKVVGVTADVTHRKQTENVLRQYERIISATPDPICLIDKNYTYTLANQAFKDWLSPQAELLGVTVADVVGADFFERVSRPRLDGALAGETQCYAEWAHNPSRAADEFISITYAPYYEADGTISGVIHSIRNITALKRTRDRLKQTAERLRLHVENSPLAVIEWDHHLRVCSWSDRAASLFGLSARAAVGKHFSELPLFPEDSLSYIHEYMEGLREVQFSQRILLTRNLSRDGSILFCEWYNSVLLDQAGRPSSVLSLIQDVTERHATQAALRESEERWQLALQGGNAGIWDWKLSTNETFLSARWKELLGYEDHELANSFETWASLVHPEDFTDAHAQLNAHLYGDAPNYAAEFRMRCKSGGYRWILSQGRAIFDAAGDPIRMVGSHTDISDRKQAEEALRRQEHYFRALTEHSSDVVVLLDTAGMLQYVSLSTTQTLGYLPHEVIGQSAASLIAPDDAATVEQAIRQAATAFDGELSPIQCQVRHKDGSWRHFEAIATSLIQDPVVKGIVVNCRDVSARKAAEQALQKSEALNRAIVEALPDLLMRIRHDGLCLDMQYPKNFPVVCDKNRHIGKKVQEVLNAEAAAARMAAIKQALDTGKIQIYDHQIVIEQHPCWEEVRVVPLADGEVLALIRDIDRRKRAEQEILDLNQQLAQQNQQLEVLVEQRTSELITLMDALPDQIFVIEREASGISFVKDVRGKPVVRNDSPISEEESSADFLLGCPAREGAQIQQVFEHGEIVRIEEAMETPKGTAHFDTYKIPLKQPNGEVYAVISTARDITELVQTRQALEAQSVQLEAANQELEAFSYSVSHDLRAPLRHINGFIRALRRQLSDQIEADPTAAHYLDVIDNSSHRMGLLIDGLLRFSQVGRQALQQSTVALDTLLVNTLNMLEISRDDPQRLQLIIHPLPTVTGDPVLLLQVFTNLVGNAVKFSRDRTPMRIEIGQNPEGAIYIRDNGVGFEMAYADSLFRPFQRMHRADEFPGTGIGLAIVQRIIHRHGGQVWVQSGLDQGATFFFTLPEP